MVDDVDVDIDVDELVVAVVDELVLPCPELVKVKLVVKLEFEFSAANLGAYACRALNGPSSRATAV